ncbi:tetratricopeptide repeat protein [Chloroflexi bacterium TSY]|nr:tetratricopeptide repeat protein [Chloroflexi bacterium TSY]
MAILPVVAFTYNVMGYTSSSTTSSLCKLPSSNRPSDASAQLMHQLVSWERESVVRRLPLAHLTFEESSDLVVALGGNATLAEQLHAKSAGNPYFLIELNRAAPAGTSPVLTELVRERVDRLPAAARQVLQAAAVMGTGIDFTTLRRISGRSEEETLNALDALLEADMLIEGEPGYEFAHPLVATVMGDDLSVARRSFLHRRAAEVLESIHAGHLSPIAGRLAAHYVQAGRPAQAAHYTEQAAEQAANLGASTEAVALYRQAILLEPTPTRNMGLGWALFAQGDLDSAREAYHQAAAEFESEGNGLGAARIYVTLAGSYMASGQGDQVIHWAEQALLHPDIQSDPEAIIEAHLMFCSGNLLTKHPLAEAEAHLTQATQLATEHDLSEIAARSQFALGTMLAERGDLTGALQAFDQSIALAHAIGNYNHEVLGHNNLAYHALLADDLVTARKHIERGLTLAEDYSLFLPGQYLYSTRGEIALAEGALGEAEVWFKRGLSEAEQYGNLVQAANIRANLGLVARVRDDLDKALSSLTEAYQAVIDLTAPHLQTKIDLWLAELYLQRGEQTAFEEALTRAEDRLEDGERKGLLAWARRIQAGLDFNPVANCPN